ncbi:flavin-dependent oxidoreductase [Naumannella sp. ID2617S]|nr:flavin-dependent oxidoreductase [Naumannella sp. ID2617S]
MQVAIIGAGIGGLSLALSLHAAGIGCSIHEAAREIRGLGVGINLLPHAGKELADLGLLDRILQIGVSTERLVYLTRRGEQVWEEPRGLAAGYHWPQVSIHRGALQMLLREAVLQRLGPDAIYTGQRVVRTETTEDGRRARAELVGPDGAPLPAVSADLIVAADGIHSAVRRQQHPDEGGPSWGGHVLWRGTTVGNPFLGGKTMVIAGLKGRKFVSYPIRHEADGRQLLNWIANIGLHDQPEGLSADWNRPGRAEDFLHHYQDWQIADPPITELVHASGEIFEYPMSDREPLPSWIFGRVVLLGDAAHAMYPIGSNGAAQAILDGRRLALELSRTTDVDAALRAYDEARRPPMTRLVTAHRAEGADVVLDLVEERAPDGYADLEQVLPMAERVEIAAHYKRLAGFDIEQLNSTPPMTPRSD